MTRVLPIQVLSRLWHPAGSPWVSLLCVRQPRTPNAREQRRGAQQATRVCASAVKPARARAGEDPGATARRRLTRLFRPRSVKQLGLDSGADRVTHAAING